MYASTANDGVLWFTWIEHLCDSWKVLRSVLSRAIFFCDGCNSDVTVGGQLCLQLEKNTKRENFVILRILIGILYYLSFHIIATMKVTIS